MNQFLKHKYTTSRFRRFRCDNWEKWIFSDIHKRQYFRKHECDLRKKFENDDYEPRMYTLNEIPIPDYYESSYSFNDFDWNKVPSNQFFGRL